MVQNVNQLKAIQAMQYANNSSGVNFGATQPTPPDSYGGKTLLTVAGVASAVIFRKNLAGFFQKVFPNASNFVAKNFTKISNVVKNFCANNKIAGKIAGILGKGSKMFVGLCDKLGSIFKPKAALDATKNVAAAVTKSV